MCGEGFNQSTLKEMSQAKSHLNLQINDKQVSELKVTTQESIGINNEKFITAVICVIAND